MRVSEARALVWVLAAGCGLSCSACSEETPASSDATSDGASSGAELTSSTPDVEPDPCAEAVDLNAADYATKEGGDWRIDTPDDALPLVNARSVTGAIVFAGEAIDELPSFSCLGQVDTLWIRTTALRDLSAFQNLGIVSDDLQIVDNPALESLNGMERLERVGGTFFLAGNASLDTLAGLEALSKVGRFSIFDNKDLDNLEGMPAVQADSIAIGHSVRDMTHLERVSTPALTINSASLQSIEGIPLHPQMVGLALQGGSLTSLQPLAELDELAVLVIVGQQELQSLDGLENLERLVAMGDSPGKLQIEGNPKLTDISALSNLTQVEDILEIDNNESLTSLVGLHNVAHTKNLAVTAHLNLPSIEPLLDGAMSSVEDLVMVTSNWALPHCQAEALCAKFPQATCQIGNNDDESTAGCP